MVTAFILINVERPRLKSIADDLLAIEGIAEVYSVAGPFDIIAIVRVKEHEQLSDLVTEEIGVLTASTIRKRSLRSDRFRRKISGCSGTSAWTNSSVRRARAAACSSKYSAFTPNVRKR